MVYVKKYLKLQKNKGLEFQNILYESLEPVKNVFLKINIMNKYWFKQKTYGYGLTPISWE